VLRRNSPFGSERNQNGVSEPTAPLATVMPQLTKCARDVACFRGGDKGVDVCNFPVVPSSQGVAWINIFSILPSIGPVSLWVQAVSMGTNGRGHSTSLLDGDTLHERMHPAFGTAVGRVVCQSIDPASEPAGRCCRGIFCRCGSAYLVIKKAERRFMRMVSSNTSTESCVQL